MIPLLTHDKVDITESWLIVKTMIPLEKSEFLCTSLFFDIPIVYLKPFHTYSWKCLMTTSYFVAPSATMDFNPICLNKYVNKAVDLLGFQRDAFYCHLHFIISVFTSSFVFIVNDDIFPFYRKLIQCPGSWPSMMNDEP